MMMWIMKVWVVGLVATVVGVPNLLGALLVIL